MLAQRNINYETSSKEPSSTVFIPVGLKRKQTNGGAGVNHSQLLELKIKPHLVYFVIYTFVQTSFEQTWWHSLQTQRLLGKNGHLRMPGRTVTAFPLTELNFA
ncbi:rCG42037 [Rattus norvegicus]|uniref:RCG42037 n=1 Tax=Rattus norvegicus TaxID=10116 RepID=A6JUQ5_RAT|nr:rCG42037 [Rattus norvegicus]